MVSIEIFGDKIFIYKNKEIVFSADIKICSSYFGTPVPENSEVNNNYHAGVTNIILNKVEGVKSLQTKEKITIDI